MLYQKKDHFSHSLLEREELATVNVSLMHLVRFTGVSLASIKILLASCFGETVETERYGRQRKHGEMRRI